MGKYKCLIANAAERLTDEMWGQGQYDDGNGHYCLVGYAAKLAVETGMFKNVIVMPSAGIDVPHIWDDKVDGQASVWAVIENGWEEETDTGIDLTQLNDDCETLDDLKKEIERIHKSC